MANTKVSALSTITTLDSTDYTYVVDDVSGTPTSKKATIAQFMETILCSATRPGGRLTLTTGVPYLTASVTAATTVYYTPAVSNFVQIYDGTSWRAYTFSEVSQATTDATKSPAAAGANSNYDMFVWNDSGTIRCTRGPAWTSDTGRGTGAGTTELERLNGILVNKVDITNGPVAQKGTYVGTIRTNGSNQVDRHMGAIVADGGTAGVTMGVWNMYNRQLTIVENHDGTNTWAYTTLTWRPRNNTTNSKIQFVTGQDDCAVVFHCQALAANSTNSINRGIAAAIDSTTSPTTGGSSSWSNAAANGHNTMSAYYRGAVLGFHYVVQLEISVASGTCTWVGDNSTPNEKWDQSTLEIWC